ncbi:hypothetical protein EDD11_006268 [Mortierella claussenii]|nr:hypothetical protein EDD11_006268 [Mortierella claussenii]
MRENGGHKTFKSPSYHHELQPIEKMWTVKTMVAAHTIANMKALRLKQLLCLEQPGILQYLRRGTSK